MVNHFQKKLYETEPQTTTGPTASKLLKPPQKHQGKTVVALSGLTRHLCARTSDGLKWRQGGPHEAAAALLSFWRALWPRLSRQNLSQGDGDSSVFSMQNEEEWTPNPPMMDMDGWI